MLEEKALKRRYRIIYIIVVLFLIVAISRLFSLQIINGEKYRIISDSRLSRDIPVKAPRGEILDRYGKPLVQNRIGYSVSVTATKSTAEINNALLNLTRLFDELGLEYEQTLPVTELKPYEFTFEDDENMTAKEKEIKFKKDANLAEDLTAEEVVNKYRDKYEFDESFSDWDIRKLAGMRYEMEKRSFSANNPYLFAEDVDIEVITRIKECSDEFSCVTVYTQPVRQYTNGNLAAHILGRIGIINPDEYEKLKEEGYGMNDYLGKQGIEKAFEKYLRGTDGVDSIERRVDGGESELVFSKEPISGNTVMLTIDRDLQAATERALEENIKRIAATSTYGNGHDANSGAAVVLDLNTGEILAIASYPTYNPERFNKDYDSLYADSATPMLNRALMGTYEPGSTYKLVTALAALEEEVITPETKIETKGVYKYYGHDFMCSIYRSTRGTHGYIDVSQALQHSCNYFFYEMGDKLGIEKLTEYSTMMGLGDYTGIELEEEVKGQLAGPLLREKLNQPWYPGDVLQAAIGQSDNLFTPIQMANYVSTIANGGKNYKLHLLKAVKSSDNEKMLITAEPEIKQEIKIKEDNLKAILDGMKLVASEGTASAAFADFPVKTGGKTGSAQVARGSSNGIYVGFAPFDDPQIAVAVVVEHGGSGGNVSYIARDIFNQYFFGNREYTGEFIPDNTLLR